jgi:hypothetical protein
MSEALAIQSQPSVHLVARNPVEMQSARAGLEDWLRAKIGGIDAEIVELTRAHESARSRSFALTVSNAIRGQIGKAKRRRAFYEKVLAAVEAGYTLIPNFPLDLFAIRVTKAKPTSYTERLHYKPEWPMQKAANAALGEGEYKSPAPLAIHSDNKELVGEKECVRYFIQATDYQDVEFPLIAARAEVMDATAQAMALKVFDHIGICPPARKGDPLIIGQVCMSNGWSPKIVSFIIAWHLDLRTL